MGFPGNIAVMGGGSWATALALLLHRNCESIYWYMRRDDRIEDFKRLGHNPAYLTDAEFDTDRIKFSSDINEVCSKADTLVLAMPSPYFRDHTKKITVDLSGKYIVSAVKGIVPEVNEIVTDFMEREYGVDYGQMLVIGGPCHAEEVALERQSVLTVASREIELARKFAALLSGPAMRTVTSTDVRGIEYAAVLKNVYSIASGAVHGLKYGDNFLAMLVCNAIREMEMFLNHAAPCSRQICDSVYLGDLLVTSYSQFSRNHNFGSMIGKGYSVRAARMEMNQTAEGYYGTKCMHEIVKEMHLEMPLLEGVYSMLYEQVRPSQAIRSIGATLT